ncbi:MAG: hypothetical protein HC882_02135, partial [Acidobacteria bacterium]|nr:hypothetical protein [Acidobacteriota bacterium]
IAKRVDALANCFVKRSETTRGLIFPKGEVAPPEGLAMRELIDEEGLF